MDLRFLLCFKSNILLDWMVYHFSLYIFGYDDLYSTPSTYNLNLIILGTIEHIGTFLCYTIFWVFNFPLGNDFYEKMEVKVK